MRGSRCRVALAAASLALLVATPGAAPRHGPALVGGAPVMRIHGAEPWDTAAAVSRATFSTATTVVVARIGVTAAVAAPLAVAVDGPLLLVPDRGVPQPVADELHRLDPTEVIIVGGPGQVPPATEAWLRGQVPVLSRIAGATPAATAALVAGRLPAGPGAVVVDAAAREDALAEAAVAAPRAQPTPSGGSGPMACPARPPAA